MFRKLSLLMVACVACCAVPLIFALGGSTGLGLVAGGYITEALIVFGLIAVIAGIWMYKRSAQAQQCCANPGDSCRPDQCGVKKNA